MTTTDMNDGSKVDVIVLRCSECREDSTLLLKACRLRLFRHGLILLNYFCLHCRELVRLEVSPSFGEALANAGIPATIVDSPQEMGEHPSATVPPIRDQDCRYMEAVPLRYFNEHVRRELRMK